MKHIKYKQECILHADIPTEYKQYGITCAGEWRAVRHGSVSKTEVREECKFCENFWKETEE